MFRVRWSHQGRDEVRNLASGEVRIGRGNENEIVLPDFSVSRRHAARDKHRVKRLKGGMTMSRFKDAAIDAGREKPVSGQSEHGGRRLAIPAALLGHFGR